MATLTPEGKVKKKVKEILEAQGIWYHMPNMSGLGTSGIPDFDLCLNGQKITIETKAAAKNKPTPLQKRQMQKLREAGAITLLVHAGNIELLAPLLERLQALLAVRYVVNLLPASEDLLYQERWDA